MGRSLSSCCCHPRCLPRQSLIHIRQAGQEKRDSLWEPQLKLLYHMPSACWGLSWSPEDADDEGSVREGEGLNAVLGREEWSSSSWGRDPFVFLLGSSWRHTLNKHCVRARIHRYV